MEDAGRASWQYGVSAVSSRRIAVLHGPAFCRFCAEDAAQQDQPDEKQPEYRHAEMDGNQAHQQEADDGLDRYGDEAGHHGNPLIFPIVRGRGRQCPKPGLQDRIRLQGQKQSCHHSIHRQSS